MVKELMILALLIVCGWNVYDIEKLQADVKKLTEDKYTITCKLGRELPGVNNTVWKCVGNGS